ncbi:rod shape-determining protein MreC [Saccharibacillus kuerlensis]|uniref:Cell shape-determining protein MreC n=1 Tax=Saccharibacillus kuerlensis TaxID=459527 RepID=A0ABQ2L775_9BACL|nr:rod shape-determining protein MreC [Saccharibacillus kuerlensis]GGO05780.1 cell shape-determining protein MreC [Saccharibacillus kuerlensis]
MFKLFRILGNRKLFILLIVLVLFVALMGVTLGDRVGLTWPERFVKDTVGFTQRIVNKPASAVSGFFEDIGDLKAVYEENENYRIQIAQYQRELIDYQEMKSTNERLKEDLKFTEKQKLNSSKHYRFAQVISVNEDVNNPTVNIDVGSQDGVEVGMAVTSIEGMVGIISTTTDYTSTIQLITSLSLTSPDSYSISATATGKTGTFGIVESYDKKENRLLMTGIKNDDPNKPKIEKGDTIVTSGSGGVFPEGIVLGIVRDLEPSKFGLTMTAKIFPTASFVEWKELFVVIPGPEPQTGDGTP